MKLLLIISFFIGLKAYGDPAIFVPEYKEPNYTDIYIEGIQNKDHKNIFNQEYQTLPLYEGNYTLQQGNDKGNGGGGIYKDGRYMTFYSAGLYTEKNESSIDEIPQLNELLYFLNNTDYLTASTRVKYIRALMQSENRRYFKVKPETFTQEIRDRLIEEYSRVAKTDKEKLTLFAITDNESGNTYLFPDYYNLKPSEQWAILFHEAYWIINPKTTYENIVDTEIKFQAYIEDQESSLKLYRFIRKVSDQKEILATSIAYDINNKTLVGPLEKDKYLPISYILGDEWIQCYKQAIKYTDQILLQNCYSLLQTHLFNLRLEHPKSMLLQIIYDVALNNKLQYITEYNNWYKSRDNKKIDSLIMHNPLFSINVYKRKNSDYYYNKSEDHRVDYCSSFTNKKLVLSTEFVHNNSLEVVNYSEALDQQQEAQNKINVCNKSTAFLSLEILNTYDFSWGIQK